VSKRRYFKELRLQQFRSLVHTQRNGSFTAAARELDLSRTSVWQQIRALEDDFGVELVVVVDHQPQLTAEGRLLFELLGPLVDAFDTVKDSFLGQLDRIPRRLTVATTSSVLNHELREPTAKFRRKYPDVSLNFIDRTSASALELLTTAKADIAVVGRVKGLPSEANLDIRPLINCPFVMACSKKHPLATRDNFRLHDLAKYPLILPSVGTNGRQRIDAVLEKEGMPENLQIAMQSSNTSVLLAYAEDGLGIALVSVGARLANLHKNRLCLQDASHLFGHEEIIIVRRKSRFERTENQFANHFAELIVRHNPPPA